MTTKKPKRRKAKLNLHPGQQKAWDSTKRIVAIISGVRAGKALALDTPIPTPGGFVPMGDLVVGDEVFDRRGRTCRVTYAFPVMTGRKCYRITFDDGTSVVADAEHRWVTQTYRQRKNQARRQPVSSWSDDRPQCRPAADESVVTTEEIRSSLLAREGRQTNHSIDVCDPVHTPGRSLPIPPYTLGLWLGDGHSSCAVLTTADPEILTHVLAEGITVGAPKDGNAGKARTHTLGAVRTNVRWDAARIESALSLYHSGKNVAEVADLVGRGDRGRVRRILKEAGVAVEKRPQRISHRKRSANGAFLPGGLVRPTPPDRNASLQAILRREGLLNNKHVPEAYLWASAEDRLSLLQGLMDSDGFCAEKGACEFSNTNEGISHAVLHLLSSLGIKASIAKKIPTLYGKPQRPCYRVTFTTDLPVFRLKRKLERLGTSPKSCVRRRFVVAVDEVPSVPVRCIAVDSPDHTYLCTRSFVPTHNTSFGPPWLEREMKRCGPGDYLAVAPTFPLLDNGIRPEIENLFGRLRQLGSGTQRQFSISEDGYRRLWPDHSEPRPCRIIYGHAQNPDSLAALRAKAAWCDEAGQAAFKLESYEEVQRRVSFDVGRILLTTTVYNLGWLKQQIWDKWEQSGCNHPEIDVINFRSIDNPAFPPEEYHRAFRELPMWKAIMFFDGKPTRPAGVIYDLFDPKRHCVPRHLLPGDWPRFAGLDFGAVNTAAVYSAQERDRASGVPTGRFIVYREYPDRKFLPGKREASAHTVRMLEGESSTPLFIGGSHSEDDWRDKFRAAGLPVAEPPVNAVEVQIDAVYGLIAAGNLIVMDDCIGLLDQLATYSRVLDARGEPTEEIENDAAFHMCAALRYLCVWLVKGGLAGFRATRSTERSYQDFPPGTFAEEEVIDVERKRRRPERDRTGGEFGLPIEW